MEHFVTIFNSLFLPQGLALHLSMQRCIKNYCLWILCVDDKAFEILSIINLSNVKLLQLSKLETEELLRVKTTRNIGEYCWTLTPFAPRFVFEADAQIKRVTYLDADLWFRKDPKALFAELAQSGKFVLITDHAYAPEYDQSATNGQYCVQFMVFDRQGGEVVRKWWEERCIEWCFGKAEDGKYGDQKYLDSWSEIFSVQVHILQNQELALAPWNATRFPYGNAVFYHFHALRILSKTSVSIGEYAFPKVLIDNVYSPYIEDLRTSIHALKNIGFEIKAQITWTKVLISLLMRYLVFIHKLFKQNIITW